MNSILTQGRREHRAEKEGKEWRGEEKKREGEKESVTALWLLLGSRPDKVSATSKLKIHLLRKHLSLRRDGIKCGERHDRDANDAPPSIRLGEKVNGRRQHRLR